MILFFSLLFIVPVVDQLIKFFIISTVPEKKLVNTFLPFIKITHTKNYGAALGIFYNKRALLIFVTLSILVYLIYLMVSKKIKNKFILGSISLIIGGGIGNLIDRILKGYVTDYILLSFFPPVCNFADYCITFGVILLLVCVIKQRH